MNTRLSGKKPGNDISPDGLNPDSKPHLTELTERESADRLWLTAKCKDLLFEDFRAFICDLPNKKALVLNPGRRRNFTLAIGESIERV